MNQPKRVARREGCSSPASSGAVPRAQRVASRGGLRVTGLSFGLA